MTIRVAGYPDIPHISRIHCSNFERGWSTEEIKKMFEVPGTKMFVDDQDGSRTAFAIIRFAADECEIISIAVSRELHGKKLGRRMLDHVKQYAAREGAKMLFLEVGEDNVAARVLYEKAGFEQFNVRKDYYQRWHGRRVDALMMRYAL